MKLNELFEEEASIFVMEDEGIEGVAKLAKRAKELEKELEDLEFVVKERKEQYRKLLEEAIPEALATFGVRSLKMDDGSQIEIKAYYSASISEARRAEAFQWLRDHGHDDLIKNIVSVRFGRGEDELCSGLLDNLRQSGYPVEQTEKVEPMTLKAWVREQVERGNEFPSELFGAYTGQKAVIKS
jgi:hypothetical protein